MIFHPKLATICIRCQIDPEIADQALEKVYNPESKSVWAEEVEINNEKYVVGQGDIAYFVCFKIPFSGHKDDWNVILPINSAKDLLDQLKGE